MLDWRPFSRLLGEHQVETWRRDCRNLCSRPTIDREIAEFLRTTRRDCFGLSLPGIEFRRLTFLENRLFPGVQGPRHWLVASPDGKFLYFLLRDLSGVVQLAEVGIADRGLPDFDQLRTRRRRANFCRSVRKSHRLGQQWIGPHL